MERKKVNIVQMIFAFGLSVLGALAFSTKIEVSTFSKHANITLADNTLLWTIMTASLFALYAYVLRLNSLKRDKIIISVLAIVFGILNVIGQSMYHLDSWDFIFGNSYQMLVGIMCSIGYAALFAAVALLLFNKLDMLNNKDTSDKGLFEKYPRLCPALVIGVVLLLWLIVYFPGYTNNDINYQLRQFFGYDPLTNSHPVLSTMIMGTCMKAGKLMGSDALGLFFYMLLQATLFTWAFSSVCKISFELRIPKILRTGIIAFYAFLPVWGAYSVQGMKDGLFTSVFTLFVLYCLKYSVSIIKDIKLKTVFYVRFAVISLMTALLRSMMQYIVAVVLGVALIWTVVRRKRIAGIASVALISTVAGFGFVYALLPTLGVIKCNKTESLSVPFQQVARIVRDNPQGISDEDRFIIDSVLDYDALKDIYMAVLSDPVKDTYKVREAPDETEKVDAFMNTWKKLARRYPADAMQATIGNVFGYFSFTPSIQTQNGHTGMCFFLSDDNHKGKVSTETYSITYPKSLAPVRKAVLTLSYLYDALPAFNLLYACAFYFWGTLLLLIYIITRKGGIVVTVALAPALLQIGCLGSSVNDCFRYEAPIAAALPVLLIAACFSAKKCNDSGAN